MSRRMPPRRASPFSGLLFLTGALQADTRHRVSARSPGIVVGPRVNRVQDTAVASARQVRWPRGGAPDSSDWTNVRVACMWQACRAGRDGRPWRAARAPWLRGAGRLRANGPGGGDICLRSRRWSPPARRPDRSACPGEAQVDVGRARIRRARRDHVCPGVELDPLWPAHVEIVEERGLPADPVVDPFKGCRGTRARLGDLRDLDNLGPAERLVVLARTLGRA